MGASDQKPTASPADEYSSPGLRNVRTTSLFRVVNFELFVKPNKYVMGLGLTAITGCVAYLLYMRSQVDDKKVYTAISETGEQTLTVRKSRWD